MIFLSTETLEIFGPGEESGTFDSFGEVVIESVAKGKTGLDVETRELVWRGTGESEIHEIRDPQERQARLNEVVDKIMKDFPPSTN